MNRKTVIYALALLLGTAGVTPVIGSGNAPSPTKQPKEITADKPLVKQPTGSPTQTFSVKEFSKVEVGNSLQVIVRKGSQPKLAAYGPKELVDMLDVKQSNGQLSVFYKNSGNRINLNQDPVVLIMETDNLTSVELSGAAKGVVEKVNADSFSFSVTGASQGQLEVTCKKLALEGSGASKLSVTGKANELMAELSGASQLNSVDLTSAQTSVEASGASKAEITTTSNLKVEASGASLVRYKGSPSEVKSDLSGASKVVKI